jgi:hypothetical protein
MAGSTTGKARGTAGTRGPVPKRSSERRRRNAESEVETVAPLVEKVPQPPGDPKWHPIALEWYESLATSGQARFYEPSDWIFAKYVAEAMSRNLKARGAKFSSVLFASVCSGMSDLLTTEASRRRVRLEIERAGDPGQEPAGVVAIADYRQRLSGKRT